MAAISALESKPLSIWHERTPHPLQRRHGARHPGRQKDADAARVQASHLTAVVRVQDPSERGRRPPYWSPGWFGDENGEAQFYCPYGEPGDRLRVRETFRRVYPQGPTYDGGQPIEHDYQATYLPGDRLVDPVRWKPSIHMPRAACRLELKIAGVRVERLNDCSEADAIAEGIQAYKDGWERFHADPDDTEHTGATKGPRLATRACGSGSMARFVGCQPMGVGSGVSTGFPNRAYVMQTAAEELIALTAKALGAGGWGLGAGREGWKRSSMSKNWQP